MTQSCLEFHLEEFKQLKSEIAILLRRIETLIRLALFGGAAIYAWILTHISESSVSAVGIKSLEFLEVATFLPPVLLFFSASLCALSYNHVNIMARYIVRLEVLLGYASYGWEQYWSGPPRVLTKALVAFFIILLVAELGVTIYLVISLKTLMAVNHI